MGTVTFFSFSTEAAFSSYITGLPIGSYKTWAVALRITLQETIMNKKNRGVVFTNNIIGNHHEKKKKLFP